MLTEDAARAIVAAMLGDEAASAGEPVGIEGVVELAGFWVFQINGERYLASRASVDSIVARIPPVVVDKRTGEVRRPFAAGADIFREFRVLGDDQWIILPAADAPASPLPDDVAFRRLSREWCAEVSGRLRHFRIRPGIRDDGDGLEMIVVAHSPDDLERGLAGIPHGVPHPRERWAVFHDRQVLLTPHAATATLRVWIAANDPDAPWSFGEEDVRVAEEFEREIDDASWIRGFIEPPGAITPATHPDLYGR
jgi:hypothetical protein